MASLGKVKYHRMGGNGRRGAERVIFAVFTLPESRKIGTFKRNARIFP
jgi:hypothetical protein